jgi:uncharacterized protein YcbX
MTGIDARRQGSILSLWRYPVKSMLGEELDAVEITDRGLLGDRAYALIDAETGKVVSAKDPRKWGNLFDFRAAFVEAPDLPGPIPGVKLTFPDGSIAISDESDVEKRLSERIGRSVRLARSPQEGSRIDGYWPEHDWLESPGATFEVELPRGTFFDGALVHFVTTSTLDSLTKKSPTSRFDVRRFRPNFVIETKAGVEGLVENEWAGRTIMLGSGVRLLVTGCCPRCVMTTLKQGDLPKDPHVLRTAVELNYGNVGVYATVIQGGELRRGDVVVMD